MSVLDAKTIGCSDPSGKMYEITAHRSYAEASTVTFNGNECTRSLESLKALVHSGGQLHPLFSSEF